MATTTTVIAAMSKLQFSCSDNQRLLKPTHKKQSGSIKFITNTNLSPSQLTNYKKISFSVDAFQPQQDPEEILSSNEEDYQGDLNYLWKLGAGSIIGAAMIKYGSVLFPEITRPNIVQALTMITAPVIIALLFLFNQSRNKQ